MRRRACDQCHGTDVHHTCEQGQCYAEHQREQWAREESEMLDYLNRQFEAEQQRDEG